MYVQQLTNEESINDFIDKIEYGINYFAYKNQQTYRDVCEKTDIINAVIGHKQLFVKVEYNEILLTQHGYSPADKIHIVFSELDGKDLPKTHNNCFKIRDYFYEAYNSKGVVYFEIPDSVAKFAKSISTSKVSFGKDENGYFYNGIEKEISTYKKMENAFYAGEEIIEFDKAEVSSQTVRCYASAISNASGVKIKCSVLDGVITVFLKPLTRKQSLKRKLVHILNECDAEIEAFEVLNEIIQENYSFCLKAEEIGLEKLPKFEADDKDF